MAFWFISTKLYFVLACRVKRILLNLNYVGAISCVGVLLMNFR